MYDDLLPPGQDSRWDVFADFHVYLEQRFPKMHVSSIISFASRRLHTRRSHANLKKTTANTYALIYHWQGSNDALKPILLTAHQGEYLCLSCILRSSQ